MNFENALIMVNGRIQRVSSTLFGSMTHALHYGTCVFDGFRVYNGNVFALDVHAERLHKSATLMGFSDHPSVRDIMDTTLLFLDAIGKKNMYIRPLIWKGDESLDVCLDSVSTNFAIFAWDWHQVKENYSFKLILDKEYKRLPSICFPSGVKASPLYALSSRSRSNARRLGFDDALLVDFYDRIADISAGNIFFLKGEDTIVFPQSDGPMRGITAGAVAKIAQNIGMKVSIADIYEKDLCFYSSAIVTSTAMGVVEVERINQINFRTCLAINKIKKLYSDICLSGLDASNHVREGLDIIGVSSSIEKKASSLS